jgi:hypothetical protein
MTLPLIAGVLVALVAVTIVSALRRAPTRIRCPDCARETEPVRLPSWVRRATPGMLLRWCPGCGWEGIGRDGAEWVPGRPVAHRSGFFWGEERLPPDFGFRFAERTGTHPRRTPRSGFVGAAERHPPQPYGFRWKDAS